MKSGPETPQASSDLVSLDLDMSPEGAELMFPEWAHGPLASLSEPYREAFAHVLVQTVLLLLLAAHQEPQALLRWAKRAGQLPGTETQAFHGEAAVERSRAARPVGAAVRAALRRH